ncbi:hypothetical protein BCR34DRAFT_584893 [Clohesyomyces aquaticus]|uniref:Uncharacterized protein n=1 Tax=Clohesyomyces aquaticus TaxID=1231657 RepID=A0A1Y1ZZM5_9PLEO|nr:hypothetical protein BCR34DRAFT_584893 [Clohesyomyces aquaticus]
MPPRKILLQRTAIPWLMVTLLGQTVNPGSIVRRHLLKDEKVLRQAGRGNTLAQIDTVITRLHVQFFEYHQVEFLGMHFARDGPSITATEGSASRQARHSETFSINFNNTIPNNTKGGIIGSHWITVRVQHTEYILVYDSLSGHLQHARDAVLHQILNNFARSQNEGVLTTLDNKWTIVDDVYPKQTNLYDCVTFAACAAVDLGAKREAGKSKTRYHVKAWLKVVRTILEAMRAWLPSTPITSYKDDATFIRTRMKHVYTSSSTDVKDTGKLAMLMLPINGANQDGNIWGGRIW